MKKTNTLLAFFLLVFFYSVQAQVTPPGIEWQKSLGDTSDWYIIVKQTTDGGYIVTGRSSTTLSIFSSISDILVIKLNNTGDIQWQQVIGDPYLDETPSDIEQTADGGYIIASTISGISIAISDYWIVKLDASGNIMWQKSLGGSGEEHANDIQQTTDGGYIVAGTSRSRDGDVSGIHGYLDDYWIVKLSGAGTIVWEKSLGGSRFDYARAIRQTTDGGYIVAGHTRSNDGDVTGNHRPATTQENYADDAWIVKLNSTGSIQWQKCLGGTGENGDRAYSIEQTAEGGYIVAGFTSSNDGDVTGNHGGVTDCWVVKLSTAGDVQWQKCLGGSKAEEAFFIKQTTDSGYILAGRTTSDDGQVSGFHGGSNHDFWIVKLNDTGDLQWQKCLGGSKSDIAWAIEQTIDNGYIVSGLSLSDDGDVTGKQGRKDIWVVKLAPLQKLPVLVTTTVIKNITGSAATDVDSVNFKLVTLTPTGGPPNALNGDVTTTATVNSTISTFNNLPFVRRHYDITPAVNAANAQALVTLYFTQYDFDLFNAYVTTNNLAIPLLPTGGVDNGNMRITQFHGNFTGTSDPANYNSGTTLIAPPTLVVAWDNVNKYWTVTFPVTHFSGFYLSTGYLTTLPLTLLEFKGKLEEEAVSLQWLTTNEVNTREFVVERGNNGIDYAAIGKIRSLSSAGNHQYNFVDASPSAGNNFYRLKMVDKDGHFTYSSIIEIKLNKAISRIIAYPIPLVSNSVNVQFINQPKGKYNFRLINHLGQVMLTKQVFQGEANRTETLVLNNNIPKGRYVLEIVAPDNSKHSFKIIY